MENQLRLCTDLVILVFCEVENSVFRHSCKGIISLTQKNRKTYSCKILRSCLILRYSQYLYSNGFKQASFLGLLCCLIWDLLHGKNMLYTDHVRIPCSMYMQESSAMWILIWSLKWAILRFTIFVRKRPSSFYQFTFQFKSLGRIYACSLNVWKQTVPYTKKSGVWRRLSQLDGLPKFLPATYPGTLGWSPINM